MRFFSVFLTIFLLLSPQSYASLDQTVVFLVQEDLSPSSDDHYPKVAEVADIVADEMKDSPCDYKFGVTNISYHNLSRKNVLRPYGTPAWITKEEGQEGIKMIRERILDPNAAAYPNVTGDPQGRELPENSSEITYSSIVNAIEDNMSDIADARAMVNLVLTDATPSFEIYNPQQAASKIREMLPRTSHHSMIIAPDMWHNMMVEASVLVTTDPETGKEIKIPNCDKPDFAGLQTEGNFVNTAGWLTHDMGAIDKFIENAEGQKLNICESDYNKQLREFVRAVLHMNGCKPMS